MRAIAAATLILVPLAAAASQPRPHHADRPAAASSAGSRCSSLDHVDRTFAPRTGVAQRLDRLPPGNLDLAVMRQIDGCPEPVTIREGYGAMAEPRRVKPGQRALPRPQPPRAQLLR